MSWDSDAAPKLINDERGLLTTWQLFNLYFEIESGIFNKERVRDDLLKYGSIEFRPENLTFIDEPKELFQNGKFIKTTIEGIQINDKPVSYAENGEIGLQLSTPIKKKSILWKKAS